MLFVFVCFLNMQKEHLLYRVNDTNGSCYVFPLPNSFQPFGPSDAYELNGEYYIGSSVKPKYGVLVDFYTGRENEYSCKGWLYLNIHLKFLL